ncbi:glycerate kinase [Novosphingobium sp. YJ-S2-02]|uniref:Glycerate kinase n=1 Tax=Novosphingobium aureum TaxID=2792964 RepID=A0A931HEF6_9SPHN|nr:glycerate kinase [Novosphingobium aureum]MBH0113864.1 glycerate kinase [Novosphingobium aureum]
MADRIELVREMFAAGLKAVSAGVCLPAHLPAATAGRTLILAIGKAAATMAREAAARMEGRHDTIVLTRYGHSLPLDDLPPAARVFEAGHPLPDEHGLNATGEILEEVRKLTADDQLLMLISGGASALLTMPAPGLVLDDKKAMTRALLACGASISEINCVRTHLSQIKGGRLALAAHPAKVVTLAMSDIPGDDIALVGSGPTIADRTKLADAKHILDIYKIPCPPQVRAALDDEGNETPFAGSPGLSGATTRIVARSRMALEAAGEIAHAAGYTPIYLGDGIEGDAGELGTVHAALALHYAGKGGRYALLSGGETTVIVRNPNGRGGRNQEYLLSLALSLDGAAGIFALACDTDGIDGTQDNAGACISPTTLRRAGTLGQSAMAALNANRSYDFFEALGDLVMTGPTRTNVNDIRIILVDR